MVLLWLLISIASICFYLLCLSHLDQHQWLCCSGEASRRIWVYGHHAGRFWDDRCSAGRPGHQRRSGKGVLPPGLQSGSSTAGIRSHQQSLPWGWRGEPHRRCGGHMGGCGVPSGWEQRRRTGSHQKSEVQFTCGPFTHTAIFSMQFSWMYCWSFLLLVALLYW